MPNTLTPSTPEAVAEDDEAAWARDFNDPAKVANFARWADENFSFHSAA